MNNFQHFLLTRINIDWNISKSRSKEERNSIDFLNYRFNIFEKTCYPSVNAQINKNFIWLILCDSNLPNEFREKIANYHFEVKILPVYISSKESFLNILKEKIVENILENTTHIITTNLDSDDVISKDFISITQHQFRGQYFEFINFPFGYLYLLNEQKLFLREWLTSPFYSLIEKYENFETVLKYSHAQIPKDKTRQIITIPMWLMTAHEQNVRTRFDVSAAWQPFYRLGSNFCTDISFPEENFLATLREFFTAIIQILSSKRNWDTPKVKSRKILNILFPSLIRLTRKLNYRQN
ncbi:MAG: glycosyltransferase [Xenococcaceae cyanobacterium MO_188.B29]|nr:glycosyltransferase [Xenococcaceae cyanobacterium MO_188.B29]